MDRKGEDKPNSSGPLARSSAGSPNGAGAVFRWNADHCVEATMARKPIDEYDEKEAQERFEAALKSALKTPHKPLKEKPKAGKVKKKKPAGKQKSA
jgi:hypothetical protein